MGNHKHHHHHGRGHGRKKEKVCKYHNTVGCRYGDSCRYIHIGPDSINNGQGLDSREKAWNAAKSASQTSMKYHKLSWKTMFTSFSESKQNRWLGKAWGFFARHQAKRAATMVFTKSALVTSIRESLADLNKNIVNETVESLYETMTRNNPNLREEQKVQLRRVLARCVDRSDGRSFGTVTRLLRSTGALAGYKWNAYEVDNIMRTYEREYRTGDDDPTASTSTRPSSRGGSQYPQPSAPASASTSRYHPQSTLCRTDSSSSIGGCEHRRTTLDLGVCLDCGAVLRVEQESDTETETDTDTQRSNEDTPTPSAPEMPAAALPDWDRVLREEFGVSGTVVESLPQNTRHALALSLACEDGDPPMCSITLDPLLSSDGRVMPDVVALVSTLQSAPQPGPSSASGPQSPDVHVFLYNGTALRQWTAGGGRTNPSTGETLTDSVIYRIS
eukprot:GFYU01000817.1.p1 GENE.GFYU01000817.1~~GFYU01000817.1.p1  ORF type:complete len:445 (+),score=90.61 GFYU01000817.1:47-1381(+)